MEKSTRSQEIDLAYDLKRGDFKIFFGAVDYTSRIAQHHAETETKLDYSKVIVPAFILATYNGVIFLGTVFAGHLASSGLVKLLR